MIEVIGVLLAAFKLGRALLQSDGGGSGDALASLAAEFLRPLVTAQDRTLVLLTDISDAVKRVEIQRYNQGMSVGLSSLRSASAPHRSREDQKHLLWTAHHEFQTAAATALSIDDQVRALVMVTACWIASGEPQDAQATLEEAGVEVLTHLQRVSKEFSQPSGAFARFQQTSSALTRLRMTFDGGVSHDHPELARARGALRRELMLEADGLISLYNDIQSVRASYGLDGRASSRLLGVYSPGEELWLRDLPSDAFVAGPWVSAAAVFEWGAASPLQVGDATITVIDRPRKVRVQGKPRRRVRLRVDVQNDRSLQIEVGYGLPGPLNRKDRFVKLMTRSHSDPRFNRPQPVVEGSGEWDVELKQAGDAEQLTISVSELNVFWTVYGFLELPESAPELSPTALTMLRPAPDPWPTTQTLLRRLRSSDPSTHRD